MKKTSNKPRNHVFLAMLKRNGSGFHKKTNKTLRKTNKDLLKKELKNSI